MSNKLIILLIFGAALALYLPFNSNIPITDPVESNYALTAKEMFISGDWISPQIYGHYWFDKPIMIYWLIALGYKMIGVGEMASRLPSGIISAASVAFTYWFANKIYSNQKTAFLCSLILATSLEFWVLARMVITDATLFFFSSVSLALFYLGIRHKKSLYYIIAYAAAGLAVLTKGPIGILLPGLIIFLYIITTRQWSLIPRLYIIPGLLVFLIIAGPWYLIMYKLHGREFIDTFLGLHNYVRATVSEHPKDNVFYYYLVLFPVSLLPWSGLLFKSIADIFRKHQPAQIYLAVWMLVILGFYSLMATKYLTYVFPASFPAALLMGNSLAQIDFKRASNWLIITLPSLFFFIILGVGTRLMPSEGNWTLLYTVIALGTALLLWLQFSKQVGYLPLAAAAVTIMLSMTVISSALVPIAWSRSAKAISQAIPKSGAVLASYGDYATSAVFYSGYVIPNLVEAEVIPEDKAWAGKYTMPNETISHFDARTYNNPNTFVLVRSKDQAKFYDKPPLKGFKPVTSFGDMTLYQRILP